MTTAANDDRPGWHREIDELHQFFEAYFLGDVDSLERVDEVLADEFTIVGAHGVEADRETTMATLRGAHAHTQVLEIRIAAHALLVETETLVVARYVETHHLAARRNDRLSTVVFRRSVGAPNGVLWVRVHETWIGRTEGDA